MFLRLILDKNRWILCHIGSQSCLSTLWRTSSWKTASTEPGRYHCLLILCYLEQNSWAHNVVIASLCMLHPISLTSQYYCIHRIINDRQSHLQVDIGKKPFYKIPFIGFQFLLLMTASSIIVQSSGLYFLCFDTLRRILKRRPLPGPMGSTGLKCMPCPVLVVTFLHCILTLGYHVFH